WPFFPWLGNRFSRVLQIPVHPVCDGLFLDAGASDGHPIADYLKCVVRSKIDMGEPAFVYGHPERRLGRFPEVVCALAEEVRDRRLVWKVALTEFAHWWLWRGAQRWSVTEREDGKYEILFDKWDERFPLGLEILRGGHRALVPLAGPRMPLCLDQLAYERRPAHVDLPPAVEVRGPNSIRAAIRTALDWETITPIHELGSGTLPARIKKELRSWQARKQSRERRKAG
ncbi:MAG TPA: hypothetical protein VGY53_07670, partial [Isosphaeraceae bacterium]|nr:hypothetical protein [Isosphaeraceae bacterium]